jgi:hypothetical protein
MVGNDDTREIVDPKMFQGSWQGGEPRLSITNSDKRTKLPDETFVGFALHSLFPFIRPTCLTVKAFFS